MAAGAGEAAVVLVVDDHPVVRHGLGALLSGEPWVERSVEADSVRSALLAAGEHDPRVAIVDVDLPDGDGIALATRLRQEHPRCRVLVLTMTADPDLARRALAAGCAGFLVKETDPQVILGAVRTVADGGMVLGPHVPEPERVFSQPATRVPPPFHRLTPRELEIVRLVAVGRSNGEIARRLSLAEKTVRNQVSTILTKVGTPDRLQLALLARDRGLAG